MCNVSVPVPACEPQMCNVIEPECAPRKKIIQRPRFVDDAPVPRSMCITLPDGKGCMLPTHLLPVPRRSVRWRTDPRRKYLQSLFPPESPYAFEGDPDYDWSIYSADTENQFNIPKTRFTYEQPLATSVGPLKLLKHPISQDEVMSAAPVCDSSGVFPAIPGCHPQTEPKSCPRLFVQEQIFRGDCPPLPRRRNLLLEGCTAEFDRPGTTNPFTGHFTPAMRYPPEYFQMRDFLAEKALEMGIEEQKEDTLQRYSFTSVERCPGNVDTSRGPVMTGRPCPGNPLIDMKRSIPRFKLKEKNETLKPCKRQAAIRSTNRRLATYYPPRDRKNLENLDAKKWKKVQEKLDKLINENERKKVIDVRTITAPSGTCKGRAERFPEIEREKNKGFDTTSKRDKLIRSKSAHPSSHQDRGRIRFDGSPQSPLRSRFHHNSDRTNISSSDGRRERETTSNYLPSCDTSVRNQTRRELCSSYGVTRSYSTDSPKPRCRLDFENYEDVCPLLERYKRAHIMSLDPWAMNPKRQFHQNRFDSKPITPCRYSAPGGVKVPASLVPCSTRIPVLCTDNCMHDFCPIKPPSCRPKNPNIMFNKRQESQVGRPIISCLKKKISPVDCLKCMQSHCLELIDDPPKDNTPCLLKDLIKQDQVRRRLHPYCYFEGPRVPKVDVDPLSFPRNSSVIGNVPHISMYKGITPHVETIDEVLLRDLAWLRSKVSSLLSLTNFKNAESIHRSRAESRVGQVIQEKKPKLLDRDVCMTCFEEKDCNKPRLSFLTRRFEKKYKVIEKEPCKDINCPVNVD